MVPHRPALRLEGSVRKRRAALIFPGKEMTATSSTGGGNPLFDLKFALVILRKKTIQVELKPEDPKGLAAGEAACTAAAPLGVPARLARINNQVMRRVSFLPDIEI